MDRWPRPDELIHVRRVDYVDSDGVTGYYEYDKRDGYVYRHFIRVYDQRDYEWKDVTSCTI